jgi:hypothetical protein
MSEQNSSTAVSSEARAIWTIAEESELIAFLDKHKAEAGDGLNFKGPVWTAAAKEMAKHTTRGAAKGPKACRSKFMRVFIYFSL